jgi:hypothetical protein
MEDLKIAIQAGLVFETVKEKQKADHKEKSDDDEKIKMKHVGSGYGKLVGGVIHPALIPVGHYVGKYQVSNPEKEIDKTKRSHRFGALMDKTHSLKTLKHGVVGAGIGAALGAVGAHALRAILPPGKIEENTYRVYDDNHTANVAAVGALLGGTAGYIGKGIKDRYATAKKMGYGKIGRIASAITPLAGLSKTKEQKDKEMKEHEKENSKHNKK